MNEATPKSELGLFSLYSSMWLFVQQFIFWCLGGYFLEDYFDGVYGKYSSFDPYGLCAGFSDEVLETGALVFLGMAGLSLAVSFITASASLQRERIKKFAMISLAIQAFVVVANIFLAFLLTLSTLAVS